jgi:PhnB protein
MARVTTYLNFMGTTEEAFEFYRSVFGTEYSRPVMRLGDAPPAPGMPQLSDSDQRLVMHVELPILGGHALMGTDMVESMGHRLIAGNNVTINLEPDTRAETERLYAALSEGDGDATGLSDMFWGSYFGTCPDRFGTRWMFNCAEPA